MKAKSLDELYELRDKIREIIPFAKLYKGKVNLGDKLVTLEELKEEEKNVRVEIAVLVSQSKLRLIK